MCWSCSVLFRVNMQVIKLHCFPFFLRACKIINILDELFFCNIENTMSLQWPTYIRYLGTLEVLMLLFSAYPFGSLTFDTITLKFVNSRVASYLLWLYHPTSWFCCGQMALIEHLPKKIYSHLMSIYSVWFVWFSPPMLRS